jgi:hypothetical protein
LVPVRTVGSTTSCASAAAEQAGAGADCFFDPVGADGVAFPDQRADVGGLIERIAGLQLLHAFDEQVGELSVDRMLDQNALHGNAGLAGVAEASGDAALGGVGEVGVAVDDDGRVAAEFENDFLFSGAALDVPADGDAAGEADELDAVVGDEQAGVFVGEREHVEAAIGPARLLYALGEKQRAERSLGRGLQNHGAAGSDGRSNFVGHEIDGEIKRRDAGDGAERETADDAPAAGGEFLPVEREIFAVDASGFFGRHVESEDGALDFGAGGFDGLAGLLRESAGKFFLALGHGGGNAAEDALALEGGQAARGAEGLDGGGDGGFGMFAAALHYAGDQAAVVGSANLDDIAVFPPPAVYEETVRRNGRDRHFCHDFSWPPVMPTGTIIGLLDDRGAGGF